MRPVRPICLALFALVLLVAPAQASAEEIPTPTLKVKAAAVPIPGFPGTGNFYGKGADVEATAEIVGSGYGVTAQNPTGSVPPVSAVNIYLPKGVKLHPSGFGSCTEATLKNLGAIGCPRSSVASTLGSVLGEVTFGSERVPEAATLQAFFGPSGSILFYTQGSTPVSLEVVSSGRFVRSSGKYSWELKALVPPVATVPGAPLASVSKIHLKAGGVGCAAWLRASMLTVRGVRLAISYGAWSPRAGSGITCAGRERGSRWSRFWPGSRIRVRRRRSRRT